MLRKNVLTTVLLAFLIAAGPAFAREPSIRIQGKDGVATLCVNGATLDNPKAGAAKNPGKDHRGQDTWYESYGPKFEGAKVYFFAEDTPTPTLATMPLDKYPSGILRDGWAEVPVSWFSVTPDGKKEYCGVPVIVLPDADNTRGWVDHINKRVVRDHPKSCLPVK